MFTYEYPRPMFTTDCVVFSIQNNDVQVLLIERGHEPFKGYWAFPGGFLDMHETAQQCAARELEEETGLKTSTLLWGCLADSPNRDPRGRVLSAVYFTFANNALRQTAQAGDDAARFGWHSLSAIPPLAADHALLLHQTVQQTLIYFQTAAAQTDFPFLTPQDVELFLKFSTILLK